MQGDLDTAIGIAANVHAGQKDKAGQPYILHCLRVMLAQTTDDARIVGVLHDAIEDTPLTLSSLRAVGFSSGIIDAIALLTKYGCEYSTYVQAIKGNELARAVKIADLRDNLDRSRIAEPTARDHERWAKYEAALALLLDHTTPARPSEPEVLDAFAAKEYDADPQVEAWLQTFSEEVQKVLRKYQSRRPYDSEFSHEYMATEIVQLRARCAQLEGADHIVNNKAVSDAVARELAKRFSAFEFDHCDVETRMHWLMHTYHILRAIDAARSTAPASEAITSTESAQ